MDYDFRELVENIYDGLYITDADRRITFWNKAAQRITGYAAEEVVGSRCSDNILIHVDSRGNNLCQDMCPLAETIQDGISRELEVYLHHKDGYRVPVWIRITPQMDAQGKIMGAVQLFTDISSRDASLLRIKELEDLAFLDHLTQLGNRRYIEQELEGRFAEMNRYGLSFGILFMDIDLFKAINDTHGHDVGDKVLMTVSRTMIHTARPFDLFGRWGGDEFIAIIRNVDSSTLSEVGERVRFLVEKTQVQTGDKTLTVTMSMGATMAGATDTGESLIKRADTLMYRSKENGRNRLTTDRRS